MLKQILKGVKSTFSPEGIGAALAIVAILAVLYYFNFGPDRVANEVRTRLAA